jgi:RNA polymerase sigma-70 factor (ECF subfamily)
VSELTSRQRNLLRLQTLEGLPVERIAKLYQVHRVTASRWLRDARVAVAERTRRRLRRTLQLDTQGMASLIRVVQSRIDMSLERILATRGAALEDESTGPPSSR